MFDITVIGAGVIGCAVAKEMSKYNLSICVLEKSEDIGTGTSKANSGIVHAGFDAPVGSLKAKFNILGSEFMPKIAKELDIPYKQNGALVLCFNEEEIENLHKLKEQGEANGVKGLKILIKEEIISREPNISKNIKYGLYAPSGGIICPFQLTIGLGENAVINGAEFQFEKEVINISKRENYFEITIKSNETIQLIKSRTIINAAGLYADKINNYISKNKFNITPRRGEYCLFDKEYGSFVSHTIFQLPSKLGKGILITPTVEGNLLLGPNAENINDKEGTNTTLEGLDKIFAEGRKSVENLPERGVITSFAGLRAVEDKEDFIIGESDDIKGFFNVAGIQSPGLSASVAIGQHVAKEVAESLNATLKETYIKERKGIASFISMTKEEKDQYIKENPLYGNVICRCELITEGEIVDAIRRPLGATTLDGIKRRTRAGMGRCQGSFCMPKVMEILAREQTSSIKNICKSSNKSQIIYSGNEGVK